MFNRKQKEIDELNERCIELARQLRDNNTEKEQLRQTRTLDARNNVKILEQDNKKTELINSIVKALYCNVKTDTQKIEKIKELISDFDSQN